MRYPVTATLSVEAPHERTAVVASAAVTVKPAGAVGAWVSDVPPPGNVTATTAPNTEVETVEIVTPPAESVSVWPTASGESSYELVAGVASISWEGPPVGAVHRIVTPLTTGSSGRKLSKYWPQGWRNSRSS